MSQPPPYPGGNNPGEYPPPPVYATEKAGYPTQAPPGQFGPPPPGYAQAAQPPYPAAAPPTAWPHPGQPGPPPPAAYPVAPAPNTYGYGPGQPGIVSPPHTVVVTQPPMVTTTTVIQNTRDAPASMRCPYCQADIVTTTHYESGSFTYLACVILCLVGCDLGCCLIPFCLDDTKDCIHSCPNCNKQVSRWNRL